MCDMRTSNLAGVERGWGGFTMTLHIGVDTGGTHTDIVLLDRDDGGFHTLKVPTTPQDLSVGILDGVERILRTAGKDSAGREVVFHYGTTLVTNIIVEEDELVDR